MASSGSQTVKNQPPGFVTPFSFSTLAQAANIAGLRDNPLITDKFTQQQLGPRFTGQSPFITALPGSQAVAPLSGFEQQALSDLSQRPITSNPAFSGASNQLAQTLSGQFFQPTGVNPFLGGSNLPTNPFITNPATEGLIQRAQGDIIDRFNLETAPALQSLGAQSGSLGNTGLAELAASQRFGTERALGDVRAQFENQEIARQAGLFENLLGRQQADFRATQQLAESALERGQGAFEAERTRQLQAAGLAPSISQIPLTEINALLQAGALPRQIDQAVRSQDALRFQQLAQEPLAQLELLQNAVGISQGGFGTQRTTGGQSGNPFIQGIGALGSLAGGVGALAPLFASGGAAAGAAAPAASTAALFGGVPFLASSKTVKKDIEDADDVLDTVKDLKIKKWKYDNHTDSPLANMFSYIKFDKEEHIGPIAEDFAEKFGGNDKAISLSDYVGVTLKAVQELNDKVEAIDGRLA